MNAITLREMIEATRLVGAGRLGEATSLLQGLPHPDAAPPPAAPVPGGAVRLGRIIDPVPSRSPAEPTIPRPTGGAPALGASIPGLAATLRDLTARAGAAGGRPRAATSHALPAGASFDDHVFASAAGQRAYKLYVPGGYDGRPLPLVVMLHGCTQDPEDFAAGTRMNPLAEEQRLLVAYPAQSAAANAQKCWNWFNGHDQQREGGEPSLLAGIVRQIARDHAVDPARVYVAGLSAGGAAAAILGAVYPDLFAAIGIHSGLACGAARDVPSAFAAMRNGAAPGATGEARGSAPRVPTIVFHGDRDRTVNPLNGDQALAQNRAPAGRLSVETVEGDVPGGLGFTRTIERDATGRPVLERWIVHGGGHAWSGGSPDGSYTEPRGPDASAEMLRFFLANAGPAAAAP